MKIGTSQWIVFLLTLGWRVRFCDGADEQPSLLDGTNTDRVESGAVVGMVDVVKDYLDTAAVSYQTIDKPGHQIFHFTLQATGGRFETVFDVQPDKQRMLIAYTAPVNVPESHRMLVSEYLTRINYNIFLGNLELDFNDGEVRYRSSVDVEGSGLSLKMVAIYCATAVRVMEQYFPGLMQVMYGLKTPAEAFEEVQGEAS